MHRRSYGYALLAAREYFFQLALTTPQANPFTTDGLGNYSFYASPGRYQIQFSGAGLTTTTIPDVILPCDPSNCTASSISVTNGISAFSLSLSGNLVVTGSVTTGSLNPSSLSTPQGGAAPAQVGPHWYPGTATGTCVAPGSAPTAAVDATVTGSIGTTTYYYKVTFFNRNGETTASPTTTFAAPSGATNAIYVRPLATDLNWWSGCYGFRVYVSNDNVNFYLQTPYTNVIATTGHMIASDAIFQSYTFSGTTPPTSNTATIDPLQVALNATRVLPYSGNSAANGMLVVPQGKTTLTTPLIVSTQEKLVGATTMRSSDGGVASEIASTWADPNLATVMDVGGNAVSIDGVLIQGAGHALMILGTGLAQLQNVNIRNGSVATTDGTGTYCALVMRGIIFNFDSDNVYYNGGLGSVCSQYASGSYWRFKGSRWDNRVSAMVSTTGFTDRDRLINFPGFPNAVSELVLENLFTESGTGIVFDAVNVGLNLQHVQTADVASSPGTAAAVRLGCDSFCNGVNFGHPVNWDGVNLAGSSNFNSMVKFTANAGNTFPGLVAKNVKFGAGASSAAIDENSLNVSLYIYGATDLCLDPACNAADGGQIINRGATYNTLYMDHVQGVRDASSVPDYFSAPGRYIKLFPQNNWAAKRRSIGIDINTNNNLCFGQVGSDDFSTLANCDGYFDSAGDWTVRGTLTWNGGNKITKVLQAQPSLTFGAIAAQTCGNQTITITGAATSNGAFASPNYAVEAGLAWSAFVSASNTVTVRVCNVTSGSVTPAASSNWRVWVVQE